MPSSKLQEIDITGLNEAGWGVGDLEGRSIALPFTLPGERVRFDLQKSQTQVANIPVEIVRISPDRVEPPCPYFRTCGGCQLQHLAYERQLKEKEIWLRNLLRGLVDEKRILPISASPKIWNYRRRVQFQIGPGGEVGFFAFHSHQVVDVQECRIADPLLNEAIPKVRERAREILASPRRPTLLEFEATLVEGGVEILPNPAERSFLQVNSEANAQLQGQLRKAFQETNVRRVVELFAGEGNLTYALADLAQEWVAVEANSAAVRKAETHSLASRVQWVSSDASRALSRMVKSKLRCDILLMDPPRSGAKECIPEILKLQPSCVAYLSCNPISLRRDLRLLLRGAYRLEWLQPFDFFPQTFHLETLAWLTGPRITSTD